MALEVKGMTTDNAKMTLWLWSRYAEPYDFRAYDTASPAKKRQGKRL